MESKCHKYFFLVIIEILNFIIKYDCVIASKFNLSVFNNYETVNPILLWKFLDINKKEIKNVRINIHELTIEDIKCFRYCIESSKMIDEMPHILELIWNLKKKYKLDIRSTSISDKDLTEILQGKLFKLNNFKNLQNKCMFSIVIECKIPQEFKDNFSEIEKNFTNNLQLNFDILKVSGDNDCSLPNCIYEKFINQTNFMNEIEMNFHIQQHQPEVNIVVFGNISKIDEKIPIGKRDSTLKTHNLQNIIKDSSVFAQQMKIRDKKIRRINMIDNTKANHNFVSRRSDKHLSDEQDEHISFNLPITNNNANIKDIYNSITTQIDTVHKEHKMMDKQSLELGDLSRSINGELPIKKYLVVDINPNTHLIANPGTNHLVTFDITNNHILTIRHYFTPRSSPLRVIATIPPHRLFICHTVNYTGNSVEIGPSQTISVAVVIQIPPAITNSVLNILTLQVQGIENLEKSAELHVRTSGNRLFDDVRPTIYYYYNNNCAGRNSAEKCLKSYWSVDITIQDSDSGLKSVVSIPKGIYPEYPYISGTSSPVHFYYSNNCCNRIVEIMATDLAENVFSKKINIEEWYNLMEGEIAAIVFGVLFIILLITLIIILFLYCLNKRKSQNLAYCQRYGSRSAPQSE